MFTNRRSIWGMNRLHMENRMGVARGRNAVLYWSDPAPWLTRQSLMWCVVSTAFPRRLQWQHPVFLNTTLALWTLLFLILFCPSREVPQQDLIFARIAIVLISVLQTDWSPVLRHLFKDTQELLVASTTVRPLHRELQDSAIVEVHLGHRRPVITL